MEDLHNLHARVVYLERQVIELQQSLQEMREAFETPQVVLIQPQAGSVTEVVPDQPVKAEKSITCCSASD